jgi:hypothetical protein
LLLHFQLVLLLLLGMSAGTKRIERVNDQAALARLSRKWQSSNHRGALTRFAETLPSLKSTLHPEGWQVFQSGGLKSVTDHDKEEHSAA